MELEGYHTIQEHECLSSCITYFFSYEDKLHRFLQINWKKNYRHV